jgi:hypothetical protein
MKRAIIGSIAALLLVVALAVSPQSSSFLVGRQFYDETTGTTKGVRFSKKFYFNPLNEKASPARYNGYATALMTSTIVAGKTTNTQFDSVRVIGYMIDFYGNRVGVNDSIVVANYVTITEGDTTSYILHNDDAFTTAHGIELVWHHLQAATGDSGTIYLGVIAN